MSALPVVMRRAGRLRTTQVRRPEPAWCPRCRRRGFGAVTQRHVHPIGPIGRERQLHLVRGMERADVLGIECARLGRGSCAQFRDGRARGPAPQHVARADIPGEPRVWHTGHPDCGGLVGEQFAQRLD